MATGSRPWCSVSRGASRFSIVGPSKAAERNPEKYGASTLGTDIPIVSEADSRKLKPDYYLVLPWHFKEEFLRREKATLDQGIGFIFPLPTIEVIRKK